MGAEIPDGAVLVARAIVNSSLWTMRPPDRVVAMTCIVLANRKPAKWWDGEKDVYIAKGQFVRTRQQMVEACNLPLQVVRTSLNHLEATSFLTRLLTRRYTLFTIPKYQHYQDLAKYSDKVSTISGENQPDFQPQTNHKQQQHPQNPSLVPSGSSDLDRRQSGRRGTDGRLLREVVVDGSQWVDPLLGRPSFRIAGKLLASINMSDKHAHPLALHKPVGQILRVVQQARSQKNPGGWAKIALESDWKLPEAEGEELREIVEMLKVDVEEAERGAAVRLARETERRRLVERKPGEDERDWLARANDEIARRKRTAAAPGNGAGAGGA